MSAHLSAHLRAGSGVCLAELSCHTHDSAFGLHWTRPQHRLTYTHKNRDWVQVWEVTPTRPKQLLVSMKVMSVVGWLAGLSHSTCKFTGDMRL